jgi:LysR family transcriptional regulator, glycine cleavage system transcriptional activator
MSTKLPPLRSLLAFEAVGRSGSVSIAAGELNVTPGAISQQIKQIEGHVGIPLFQKDGRGLVLSKFGKTYHHMIAAGFETLREAQNLIVNAQNIHDISISGLPSLMIKWLNPNLPSFKPSNARTTYRMECTHIEPDRRLLDTTFRLTYGEVAFKFPHSKVLFTDHCYPVCSPSYLEKYPEACTPDGLRSLDLIAIAWQPMHNDPPGWPDWFRACGVAMPKKVPITTFQLSSLALEAAANGDGVALGQDSFVEKDLLQGRLVRISDAAIRMPFPYYVCWSGSALSSDSAIEFLDWISIVGSKRGPRLV